jgi:hypothetical protein
MKKLAVLSTAALIGLGSIAASTTEAEARWRGHRGGAVAAGVIGGLAAGALIGAAASNAYAYPGYDYGYAPVSYAPAYYAPAAYYEEPAPVVVRRKVVRHVAYAPVQRRRVVVYDDAPVYRTRVVHRVPAYSYGGYAPAYWGGPSVSVGFGTGHWW